MDSEPCIWQQLSVTHWHSQPPGLQCAERLPHTLSVCWSIQFHMPFSADEFENTQVHAQADSWLTELLASHSNMRLKIVPLALIISLHIYQRQSELTALSLLVGLFNQFTLVWRHVQGEKVIPGLIWGYCCRQRVKHFPESFTNRSGPDLINLVSSFWSGPRFLPWITTVPQESFSLIPLLLGAPSKCV